VDEDKLYRKLFSSAMHPFKLKPFYFKAKETNSSVITLATICTHQRIEMLPFLAERWGGPLSITYHLEEGETLDKELQKLKEVYEGSDFLRKFASIHLIIDNLPLQLNLWRNIARFYSDSPSVLILDVEFVPNPDMYSYILKNWNNLEVLLNKKTALVVPAYELTKNDLTIPETKSKLLELVEQNQAQMFHAYWYHGQGHTNHQKWETTDVMYPTETYNPSYEPYLIYSQDSPFCDERFYGYGSNKCACVYELVLAGYELQVLPESFIVHRPHGEYSLSSEERKRRTKENEINGGTFMRFMKDIRFKYEFDSVVNEN